MKWSEGFWITNNKSRKDGDSMKRLIPFALGITLGLLLGFSLGYHYACLDGRVSDPPVWSSVLRDWGLR